MNDSNRDMRTVTPPGWPRPSGYSHAISAEGATVFVSGQIGWDEDGRLVSDDFVDQLEQTLKNTMTILSAAGARPQDIARMTWYITDKTEYLFRLKDVGRVFRQYLAGHYPAMSVVQVSALVEDGAKVEVETTAVIADAG